MGRRRDRGRDARRDRRAAGVEDRRPHARRHAARDATARTPAGRVASRLAAAGAARLAQGAGDPRQARPRWPIAAHASPQQAPAGATTSTSTSGGAPGHRHGPPVYGDRTGVVTYSKLDGRHLLASWIPLVALTAQQPDRDWAAVCIGRGQEGRTTTGADARAAASPQSTCCATSWRSTTPAAASRSRCRSRRLTRGRKRHTAAATPTARGGLKWKHRPLPRRGRRTRPRRVWGALAAGGCSPPAGPVRRSTARHPVRCLRRAAVAADAA